MAHRQTTIEGTNARSGAKKVAVGPANQRLLMINPLLACSCLGLTCMHVVSLWSVTCSLGEQVIILMTDGVQTVGGDDNTAISASHPEPSCLIDSSVSPALI